MDATEALTMTAEQLQADAVAILADVEAGAIITITQAGRPVATLTPTGPMAPAAATEQLIELLATDRAEPSTVPADVAPADAHRALGALTAALSDPVDDLAAATATWVGQLPDTEPVTVARHLGAALNRDNPRRRADLEALVDGWRSMSDDEITALSALFVQGSSHRRRLYLDHQQTPDGEEQSDPEPVGTAD